MTEAWNFAKSLGATEPEAERELAKAKDWALQASGAKGVKRDWDAFWRNWVRGAAEAGKFTGPQRSLELVNPGSRAPPPDVTEHQWRARLQWARENDDWRPQYGPLYGEAGCLIPDHLMTEPYRDLFNGLRAKLALQRKAG